MKIENKHKYEFGDAIQVRNNGAIVDAIVDGTETETYGDRSYILVAIPSQRWGGLIDLQNVVETNTR